MRRRDARGFSLIETMIVLFLTAAMLYCVGKLTSETLSTLKFLQEKSATTESATLACQRLASELKEAVSVPDRTSGVSFRKVIPSSSPAVGNVPNDPDPTSWAVTYPAGFQVMINYNYSSSGQKVTRQVGSETPLEIATKVNTFAVTRLGTREGAYRVALTIWETRRPVTFETIVVCPGVPR